ncbi:hypothetical protein BCR42DRAFT_439249 [Absidia repens]|uniref:DDRGK domain-domain-containing protein n=1 Tax=Absidia repens TaxID=90262 RepID=A0A1X2IBQ7_9FUNG|nr:hypothetical protein BCR42DRAFT_439249 [Absidia repens]
MVDIQNLTLHEQDISDDDLDQLYDDTSLDQDAVASDEENNDNAGEGSSTLRIRKVGKKKGEKLRRKEQMRQYREDMNQQHEARRAQDEILDEEYRRRKAEEAIQRADEMEKRRKRQEKMAKQEEKARLAQAKQEEKELVQKQKRFQKYHAKLKARIKDLKVCNVGELAKYLGISAEETDSIIQQLCDSDTDFDLSLWSDDRSTFMFVVLSDYDRVKEYMEQHQGSVKIKEALDDSYLVLGR